MQTIYLDTAATTKMKREVSLRMQEVAEYSFGNPSSLHELGLKAERLVDDSRKEIAKSLYCAEKQMIFTGSGTEANNLAILGPSNPQYHYITTNIEHPSVLGPFKHLQSQGAKVTYLPVDEKGYVSPLALQEALNEKTRLISIGMVNNEIGTKQQIAVLAEIAKNFKPSILFHTDAIQAWGKVNINLKELDVDYLSLSGHKIGGPKGIGCLFAKNPNRLRPLIFGGGQEQNLRSGTENVPAIVGLSLAAKDISASNETITRELKIYFYEQILERIENVELNGPLPNDGAPHILNLSFLGVQAQVLLQALSACGIYVSSGSACSVHNNEGSHVLKALGKDKGAISSALRFSFSADLSKEQIDFVVLTLEEKVKHFREIIKYG